jgi:16S rRNA (cytidine1402-2'-O)-methyltransferase
MEYGTLFVVATPIGNMEDITVRAIRTLEEVDVIACEDTRVTGKLLERLEIPNNGRLISFHSRSGAGKVEVILDELKAGKNVALVSDAGTPCISDPGFLLVNGAVAAGLTVSPIPGVSAVIGALSGSGFPADKFVYLGFLPVKKGRQTIFGQIGNEFSSKSVVFYESVHRIVKTLNQMKDVVGGERYVCIAREITKMYEEFWRGTLEEAVEEFGGRKSLKGEFVVVVGPEGFELR